MTDCDLCDKRHPRGSPECPGRRVGRLVAEKYRVERLLGAGAMGAVYAATHLRLGIPVALKMLHPSVARGREASVRFQREARVIAALKHPHIVAVCDLGEDADGSLYIEMEILHGRALDGVLDSGRLPVEAAVDIVLQALEGLQAAHDHGVVHRDIKPANLFLEDVEKAPPRVKVLDFGIARVASDPALTRDDAILGTPLYMSPEQVIRSSEADARADLYSVGAVLFHLLTGHPPVQGGAVSALLVRVSTGQIEREVRISREDVPEAVAAVVRRALAHDPAARFETAREMSEALKTAVRPAPVSRARPPPGAGEDPKTRPARSQPTTSIRLGLGAVMILALSAATALTVRREQPRAERHRGRDPGPAGDSGAAPRRGAFALGPPVRAGTVALTGGVVVVGTGAQEAVRAQVVCREVSGTPCETESLRRERPSHAVRVAPFSVDATEVDVEAFARWLGERPGVRLAEFEDALSARRFRCAAEGDVCLAVIDTRWGALQSEGGRFAAVAGREHYPAVQVTWYGASRYCRSRGGRLPTETEWEFAARGAARRTFPWGESAPDCRGVSFGRLAGGACEGAARDASLRGPVSVGSSPQDRTPEGVFDLGGNAAEWVADRFREYPPCATPCADSGLNDSADDSGTDERCVRGGSWAEGAQFLRSAGRGRMRATLGRAQVGFRCAYDRPQ